MSRKNYVEGKVIVVTGAGGGFGRLIAQKATTRGARLVCGDINEAAVKDTVDEITGNGGDAIAVRVDVTSAEEMKALAKAAVDKYGRIDVMINNAGIMPLAFFSDHAEALPAWQKCIDINFKGVLHGMVAVYDQMIEQGQGHVINVSSIYGNFPVIGAAVYGATKSAVNFLSESLRVEARGKIKVTIVKPTGVPTTGLGGSVVNTGAAVGILGQNAGLFGEMVAAMNDGTINVETDLNPESIGNLALDPSHIADEVLHAIDQPLGVSIGDITVRAVGDHYIL